MHILDCTLRDGGYRNNWQFSTEEVQGYLDSVKGYGVDIAEIGFRYHKKESDFGICAYTPEWFIESLQIPEDIEIAVMIKAEQFQTSKEVKKLFVDSRDSRVDMVRVAVQYEKAANCRGIIDILKVKGYKVSLNLTKIHPESTINVEFNDSIDLLYLADTFGKLSPDDVRRFIGEVKHCFEGPVGFHGHNNRGLALSNSLAAIDSGATYIDSTINGVGKGFGNVKTEDILREVKNERVYIL